MLVSVGRPARAWYLAIVGAVACGTSTPPEQDVPASTSEAIALEHAALSSAVAVLGRALEQPIRLAADAEALGPCARVTMFVPAGAPIDVARRAAADGVEELGLSWKDEGGSVVIARRAGAEKPQECQARDAMRAGPLGIPRLNPSSADAAPRRPDRSAERSPDLKDPFAPVEGVAGISAIDETTWKVEERALEGLSTEQLVRQARIIPRQEGGATSGYKVFGIRAGSIPSALGLANGDVIVRVGGAKLTDLEAALAAFDAFREATTIEVEIERRGQLRKHTYEIVR
jgi:hypothetical protein